jgi:cytochrome o ubiquinol oxidase subunit 1
MPLYALGFLGMTRRLNHYDNPEWHPYLLVAAFGAAIIGVGIICQIIQIVVSVINREKLRDVTGDPWGARTLEWSLSSPPPFYNFAEIPVVHDIDPVMVMKQDGTFRKPPARYEDIHMPRNTGAGFIMGMFSLLFGFGFIWYMWWAVILGALGMLVTLIVRMFDEDVDYYVPAAQVKEIEEKHLQSIGNQA